MMRSVCISWFVARFTSATSSVSLGTCVNECGARRTRPHSDSSRRRVMHARCCVLQWKYGNVCCQIPNDEFLQRWHDVDGCCDKMFQARLRPLVVCGVAYHNVPPLARVWYHKNCFVLFVCVFVCLLGCVGGGWRTFWTRCPCLLANACVFVSARAVCVSNTSIGKCIVVRVAGQCHSRMHTRMCPCAQMGLVVTLASPPAYDDPQTVLYLD